MQEFERRLLTVEFKLERVLELEKRVIKLERAMYLCMGALACLNLILKFVAK